MTAMIRLEELTKHFPGQAEPAVDTLTMDIPKGEIVVFVGPSGCGKTTTMKLINRLVQPTSGRIILDDQDVTDVDPDRLRRRRAVAAPTSAPTIPDATRAKAGGAESRGGAGAAAKRDATRLPSARSRTVTWVGFPARSPSSSMATSATS